MTLKELKETLIKNMETFPILKDFYNEDWIKNILNESSDLDNWPVYTEWVTIGETNESVSIDRLINFAFLEPIKMQDYNKTFIKH